MASAYQFSPLLGRDAWLCGSFDHAPHRVPRRPLRVYALDPAFAALEGGAAVLECPWEALQPGPCGHVLKVQNASLDGALAFIAADLDAPEQLRNRGYAPDPASAAFHAQMTYAIAARLREKFCQSLGRTIGWAFPAGEAAPLRIYPLAGEEKNAFYSRAQQCLAFGYFKSDGSAIGVPSGKYLFTSMSGDVVAHETAHALLDAVRPWLLHPGNADTIAFHESFADIVALLQRYAYPELVRGLLRASRGSLAGSGLAQALAPEFARGAGLGVALRTFETAPEPLSLTESDVAKPLQYDKALISKGPHELGRVMTEAVMEAFVDVVTRRSAPVVRLATDGTGVLPAGEAPADLIDMVTQITCKAANELMAMCIRALDYCPVVNIEFGEFLRALATVETELGPETRDGFRTALIRAFQRRALYPRLVETMSVSALNWEHPYRELVLKGLALNNLNFFGDPASPCALNETYRQAGIVGEALSSDPALAASLGFVLDDAAYGVPEILDVRPTRRIGSEGQLDYDLVVQITQTRRTTVDGAELEFVGGTALLFDQFGALKYAVVKRANHDERLKDLQAFIAGDGAPYWTRSEDALTPVADICARLCNWS